jgi:hypothetical protein
MHQDKNKLMKQPPNNNEEEILSIDDEYYIPSFYNKNIKMIIQPTYYEELQSYEVFDINKSYDTN